MKFTDNNISVKDFRYEIVFIQYSKMLYSNIFTKAYEVSCVLSVIFLFAY